MIEDPPPKRATPKSPGAAGNGATRLRTLLICDLADSTALVERLGDSAAAELIRRHDRVARDLLHHHSGREIDKTDGFLALFERPIEAVGFALSYQRALRVLSEESGQSLRARVGVHVGEVVVFENNARDVAGGAKTLDVEGLAKPVVARLMSLAVPGQILLSGVAFSLAQRAEGELALPGMVRWMSHGRYRFKGVPAPMLVHEVGEPEVAPLSPPPSSSKAQRDVALWRKPVVLAVEVIALLLAVAIPFALTLRAPPAIAFGERDWVVVGQLRNLTGEPLLNESLETAFRISLEQSRYVNVLSDLKLRDALARMQRPADTVVDREVASEIALRDGARAVILPTVAEIGGRVRVSAEVIDPHSQTTVYAESADGVGAESALTSIDTVTRELRDRLGEAMKSIENDSAPLPKVTSGSLEALRAYALGNDAYAASQLAQARTYFEQALQLDPEFALAHIGLARVEVRTDRLDSGIRHAQRASQLRGRLTPRDALYVDAWAESFGPPDKDSGKWSLMATLYPDFHTASYNAALFHHVLLNQHRECERTAQAADVSQYLYRGDAVYLRAGCLAGINRLDESITEFERAESLGVQGVGVLHAYSLAAAGQHQAALRRIDSMDDALAPGSDWDKPLARSVIAIDQGDFTSARAQLRQLSTAAFAQTSAGSSALMLQHLVLALLTRAPEDAVALDATRFVDRALEGDSDAARRRGLFAALGAGYVAGRGGDLEAAQQVLSRTGVLADDSGFPVHRQLVLALRAQVRLLQGDPAQVLSMLAPDSGQSGLLQWRVIRIAALRAAGQHAERLAEADRLAEQRGAAVVESLFAPVLRGLNLADVDLALLDAAEAAAALGDNAAAEERLQRFTARWDPAQWPAIVRRRVQDVREQIDASRVPTG